MTKQEMQKLQEEKNQIEQIYEEMLQEQQHNCSILGQEYYKKVIENPELMLGELASYVEGIKNTEERLASVQNQMTDIEKALEEPIDNICPKCGKVMEAEAKFCSACGTPLDVPEASNEENNENICKNCGNVLRPEARFCGKCGMPVTD